jgi:hypothetical protein
VVSSSTALISDANGPEYGGRSRSVTGSLAVVPGEHSLKDSNFCRNMTHCCKTGGDGEAFDDVPSEKRQLGRLLFIGLTTR